MKKQHAEEVIELLTRAADEMRRWLEQQNKQYEEEGQSPGGGPTGEPAAPEEGSEQSSAGAVEDDFIGCGLRSLPRKLILEGAATAVSINPANAPVIGPMAALGRDFVLKPLHLALLTSKYWGKEPRTVSVSFMENCPQDLRDKIISHMNGWADGKPGICIRFAWTQGMGEVRISRGQGGYYSYLGTDILHIPRNQQTMNLQGFTMQTRDSEFYRVVRHETGHTLGFPHEHMRRELVARINPQKAIEYFRRTQGWDANAVRQQVLTPLDEQSIMGTPGGDETSIMCYQLPGSITVDGKPIVGGEDINATDREFAFKLYPGSSVEEPDIEWPI
jgi:hypothetical protein